MKGPLKSLKIVEFSGLGPGPLAGQLLADLGADVILSLIHISEPTRPY